MNDQPVPQAQSASSIEEISLHSRAAELASKVADDYRDLLIMQGRVLAKLQRADEVQKVHIEEARQVLSRPNSKGWSKELLLIIGGGLFGAFIQGFVEAVADHKTPLIVIFALAGFAGMGMIFWALRQR